MGRLDNAMRRAAEERAARQGTATLETRDDSAAGWETEPVADFDLRVSEPDDPPLAPAGTELLAPVLAGADEVAEPQPAAVPAKAEPRTPSLLGHVDESLSQKVVADEGMAPASKEQYRRLAAAFHQAQRANGFKVAMVASAVAGEGKTLTATNLALTLSQSYRRNVLLVDGDLRRPSLHTIFKVPGAPGLSDGLLAGDEPKLPLHRISDRLTILTAGAPTSDPIGALTSDRMRRLVEEAREVFDWVIIDTPPVGLLTDAALLSGMADGVVLVVKAGSTQHDMVSRAVELIGRERVIGVVLNRATEIPSRSTYDYSKYYYNSTELTTTRG